MVSVKQTHIILHIVVHDLVLYCPSRINCINALSLHGLNVLLMRALHLVHCDPFSFPGFLNGIDIQQQVC